MQMVGNALLDRSESLRSDFIMEYSIHQIRPGYYVLNPAFI